MSEHPTAPRFGDERLPERFWSKVHVNAATGCWEWTAALVGKGYGGFGWERRVARAHRLAYEALVGPIPDGLDCDHICRVRRCVNPAHIEPVTRSVNAQRGETGLHHGRKTHCPRGHPYDEANTRVYRGVRHCRACNRERMRQHYARRRLAQ